jgi:sortase A
MEEAATEVGGITIRRCIMGTAKAGESGNIGIAGHRDGFFRGLKDVVEGDEIHILTRDSIFKYRVDQV